MNRGSWFRDLSIFWVSRKYIPACHQSGLDLIHYKSIEIGTIYGKIEYYDLARLRHSLSSESESS
jgi:hypothetical protein